MKVSNSPLIPFSSFIFSPFPQKGKKEQGKRMGGGGGGKKEG